MSVKTSFDENTNSSLSNSGRASNNSVVQKLKTTQITRSNEFFITYYSGVNFEANKDIKS